MKNHKEITKLISIFALGLVVGGLVIYAINNYTERDEYDMRMTDGHNMSNMDNAMMDMNSELLGKSGDELDKAFLIEMTKHHNGAIEMAKILKAGTNRQEMRDFADNIINAQAPEVSQMQKWLKEWFGK